MNFIIANYETILTFPREQKSELEGQADINCWATIRYTVASKISHISLKQKLSSRVHSKTSPPVLPDLKI